MLGGADNPNGELLSYIIGADSLTVTEYDIDSVTCEMVRMVSSYGDQSTTRE